MYLINLTTDQLTILIRSQPDNPLLYLQRALTLHEEGESETALEGRRRGRDRKSQRGSRLREHSLRRDSEEHKRSRPAEARLQVADAARLHAPAPAR